ncbi:MAG: TetR/AcrR family transcriptional regulator [Hydrogenophilales bacterium]
MPKKNENKTVNQKEKIINCAALLFAKYGYNATSIKSIAESCKVSKSLIYHYYFSKEDMLYDIAQSHINKLISIIDDCSRLKFETNQLKLKKIISQFMIEYKTSKNRHKILIQDIEFLKPSRQKKIKSLQMKVVRSVAEILKKINPQIDEVKDLIPVTMGLFGMINWTFTWINPSGKMTYKDVSDLFTNIFINGLKRIKSYE